MSQQQTVLRVRTNNLPATITGATTMSISNTIEVTYTGSGTTANPFTGITTSGDYAEIDLLVANGNGTFYYDITAPIATGTTIQNFLDCYTYCLIKHANGFESGNSGFQEYNTPKIFGSFEVYEGDVITFQFSNLHLYTNFKFYIEPSSQENNIDVAQYDYLDLYDDIPIKINKSFAELQDISKRNSDYSIGLQLPGSKRNNKFFEDFFNVDVTTLFFDATKRVPCNVTINDEVFFRGYLRLNKASVINSKNEYDVTLYSNVGDIFGKIGNNLLYQLNFDDIDFHFNHYFNIWNTLKYSAYNGMLTATSVPNLWSYPIVHNGYNYSGDTVSLSGATASGVTENTTRLYTSTQAGAYNNYAAFTSDGGLEYRINSPKYPLIDNQLKPSLNVWGLFQLIFKTYGYTIKSNFLNTPWFKLLNMYGYYNSNTTKFTYTINEIPVFPKDQVTIVIYKEPTDNFSFIVTQTGTNIPCYCEEEIKLSAYTNYALYDGYILANTSGYTMAGSLLFDFDIDVPHCCTSTASCTTPTCQLAYYPVNVGEQVPFNENVYVNFANVFNPDLKQIDFLSSIAKKFDLVFIPDPDVENQIIIEAYDYYIGTGVVHDWTNLISYDKGWSVQPSLNFIESEIILTDLEDGDDGNKQFKDRNFKLYGENRVFNITDFKSQTKKIETTFSPEVIRKWDERIGLPLGINYAASNSAQSTSDTEKVKWEYKGIKSKPKLFFNLGNLSPFLDTLNEAYDFLVTGNSISTILFRTQKSDGTNIKYFSNANNYAYGTLSNQSISHTMPIGNPDNNKTGRGFNNDSISILFNSQEPQDIGIGIPTYNCYTDNDAYYLFYQNRINNIFNKNTRFLEGNFYLKYSDILNLRVNDLIKVQQQYFTVNKIDSYNLTNQELTKVELLQVNVEPKTYPTRYFNYQYCGDDTVYKFRTYFNPLENPSTANTNLNNLSNFRRTYYFWSILYDYFIGILGGNVSGYTTSITAEYAPYPGTFAYSIWEINEDSYNASGITHTQDILNSQFIDGVIGQGTPNTDLYFQNPWIWLFSNQTPSHYRNKAVLNLSTNCTGFTTLCSTNYITLTSHPGPTPTNPYHSGILLNVTKTGWIKYSTSSAVVYKQITSTGNYTIPDCADCSTVKEGIPFAQIAVFTITDCGSPC